jgi:hypothetical protein
MFAALCADGLPIASDGETESVTLEFGTGAGALWRCRACGEDLTETTAGWAAEAADGLLCAAYDPADGALTGSQEGRHDPERIPLSWCNGAGIRVDESADSVTLSLSVGDPRGAFTFTLRRICDDAPGELAGRIVLHTPYPGESLPHMPLTAVRPGTYLVGATPAAAAQLRPASCDAA